MTETDMAFELHFEELGCCGRFARVAGLCGELEIIVGGEARDLIRLEDGEVEGELLRWATDRYGWKCAEAGNAEIVLLDSDGYCAPAPVKGRLEARGRRTRVECRRGSTVGDRGISVRCVVAGLYSEGRLRRIGVMESTVFIKALEVGPSNQRLDSES